jgi:CheY-like chemotaxis protein
MATAARILIIDDDPEIREVIHAILSLAGHTVIEAGGVTAALRRLGETAVDIVITDIIMPDRDGLEAIRTIRESRPDVKIIAISGGGRHLGVEVLRHATRLGADIAITKPFASDRLLSAVAQLAGRQRSE